MPIKQARAYRAFESLSSLTKGSKARGTCCSFVLFVLTQLPQNLEAHESTRWERNRSKVTCRHNSSRWGLLKLAVFRWSGLRRRLKTGKVCVVPELIEETLPIILYHFQVNVHATLKYCRGVAVGSKRIITEKENDPRVELTHLHKPVVRRSLVSDVNFALYITKMHIFTFIHDDKFQRIRTLSQHRVNPTKEPVGMEHLSVAVLPEWGDPETGYVFRPIPTGHITLSLRNLSGTMSHLARYRGMVGSSDETETQSPTSSTSSFRLTFL